jgi:hypothetical protein
MEGGGRHRSDRAAGMPGWAAVAGLVLLAVTIAGVAVLAAALLL